MVNNTFGQPVDDSMLDTMPRYAGQPKTREDRAREASNLIDSNGKHSSAMDYVNLKKAQYGNGVTALCLVYNATGEKITLHADHDWYGHIGPASPYPSVILNGQWGAFLHVHPTAEAVGSTAAVVYGAKNKNGSPRDILLAWDVPWGLGSNKAFADIAVEGVFPNQWSAEETALSNSDKSLFVDKFGSRVEVQMGNGTSPTFTAKLSTLFSA